MSESSNKLTRFWEELKKRKTARVIVVYASAGFILLQLADILTPALLLPAWTTTMVTLLLALGFPVAIIFSWVYDITPEGVQKTKSVRSDRSVKSDKDHKETESSNRWKLISYVSIVIILAFVVFNIFINRKQPENLANPEKTIAVLPFQIIGNDSVQLPLCYGFMQDIINNLQKVKSFTVRPRASSYQYKDTKKSTVIIGKELNVNYLVEGSVGREGNNLKILVELSDTKADKQVWSNDYFGKMNQEFSLQSEIAKDIAAQLKAALSPDEVKNIEKNPTENPEANKYYLQGDFYYWHNDNSGDTKGAIELFEKAIELDSGFALAYTGIAKCLLDQYWYYKDRRDDVLRNSKKAIDKAFKIDPSLPEAHLALGIYYYNGYLNYKEALDQFKLVLKDQPNNSLAIEWSAAVYRRAGNWDKAKSYFEKATELNPLSPFLAEEAGETFDLVRDYSKAEGYYNKSIMLQPDYVFTYNELSKMYLRWKGETGKAREILRNAEQNSKTSISDSIIIETNVLIDIYEGKYKEALKDLSHLNNYIIQTQFYYRPKSLYNATIYGLMNKHDLEQACYDSARILLESGIRKNPDDSRLYSSLGIVYAGLGLKAKAIDAGTRGVELMPINKDAYRGIFRAEDLALINVMVGNFDDAIKQLNYLLTIPGFLTTKILELDPRWAPLRNQPEFKKLLEEYTVN